MKQIILVLLVLAIGMVSCTSGDLPTLEQDAAVPPSGNPPQSQIPINTYTDSFVLKFSEIARYKDGKEISVQKTPITLTYNASQGEFIFDRQGPFGASDIIRRKYWISPTIGWSFLAEVMDYSGGDCIGGYLLSNDYLPKDYSRWNISQTKIEIFEMGNNSTQVGKFKDWELR